jgi:RimJ/RimL family protein N-acetyltransferase
MPMSLRLPIITRRLHLRDFGTPDVDAVFAYAADPAVAEHMFHAPWSHAQAAAYVEGLLTSQHTVPRRLWELAIVERSGGALIGSVDLTPEGDDAADLGYVLARPAWGRGVASEAAGAMLDAGFARLGLRRISAMCAVENVASRRVLEKIGLRHVDTVQRYRQAKGRDFDVHRFELRRTEWSPRTR